MANADDTRDTAVPANIGETRLTASNVLEALLAKLSAAKKEPAPPRHARPPAIKAIRHVTVTGTVYPAHDTNTPWIRLCGHWLEHAGFPLHTRVRVLVVKGCLILIPEPAAAP